MTLEPLTKRGRGRPLGSLGARNRRLQLAQIYTDLLGGTVTPIQEKDITRAVDLQDLAEKKRAELTKQRKISADELLALAQIEEAAAGAVRRLNLPVPTTISTVAA